MKNYLIRQVLLKPHLVGRMIKWVFELFKFYVTYDSYKALKARTLANLPYLKSQKHLAMDNICWILI